MLVRVRLREECRFTGRFAPGETATLNVLFQHGRAQCLGFAKNCATRSVLAKPGAGLQLTSPLANTIPERVPRLPCEALRLGKRVRPRGRFRLVYTKCG